MDDLTDNAGQTCPHGDPTCPCPDGDGDPCHYKPSLGTDPMRCPRTGVVGCKTCRPQLTKENDDA